MKQIIVQFKQLVIISHYRKAERDRSDSLLMNATKKRNPGFHHKAELKADY